MVYAVYNQDGSVKRTFKHDMTHIGSYPLKRDMLDDLKKFKKLGHDVAWFNPSRHDGRYALWVSKEQIKKRGGKLT